MSKEERVLFYHKNIQDIRDIISKNKIELVISNTANVFQGALAAACESVPHFWLIHEFPEREFAYYVEKFDFMLDNSDEVFAVQGNLKKSLEKFGNRNHKLQSFIPFTEISDESLGKGEQIRIVSIGLINENKNQMELLQAYLKLGRFDIPLIFIGDWEEDIKQECDEFIEKHSLNQVRFLGYRNLPWKEITSSDICVFNSKSESFSLVFIEAILKGVPTIVSDNLGYSTVRNIFNTGFVYPLGNIDSLTETLENVIENFQNYKCAALETSQVAKQLYTIENCYEALLSRIEKSLSPVKNSLQAIELLLGNTLPNHSVFEIKKQFVTFFYSKLGENFSEENSLRFPLEYSDEIYVELPSDVMRLRVDLSEIPSYYKNVKLQTYKEHEEIPIDFTNGIALSDSLLFGKNDPQIHYNLESISETKFTFFYEMKDIFEPMREGSLLTELSELQLDNLSLQERIIQLEEQYQALNQQYHAIIGSRRWQLSTKIINFLRRKK